MTESAVPSEVEAKLLVPSGVDLGVVAKLRQLGRFTLRPRDTARLHSVYLDTATFALARHGIALRVRRHAGRWEATAKWSGEIRDDVHARPELTVPLPRAPRPPFALPPGPLEVHLAAIVAGRPLVPILVSDITRRRIDIVPAGAGADAASLAELALDRVHLRAPDSQEAAAAYAEVEIELLAGTRRDVIAVAHALRRRFGLQPSHDSKFARGMMLLYGRKPFEGVRRSPVAPGDTVQVATRKTIDTHLRRLRQHDPGTRLGQDPEALHDMRVALRRLRAAVRAFDAAFPERLYHFLTTELHWLGQILGGVRDIDVQLQLLDAYAAGGFADASTALTAFRAYLESERQRRRTDLLQGLASRRYFRLLVRLEAFVRGRTRSPAESARAPIAAVGRTAIKKAFRRLLKQGRAIDAAPSDQDLHALRIRAKRLRYLLEFLSEVIGKPGRRLVKDLVRLQDLLGSHHDAVVAAAFIRRYVEGPGAQANAAAFLALGAFMGEQRRLADVARGEFQRAWERFARRRTLKDLDAVLDYLHSDAPPELPPPPTATTQETPQ